MRKTEVKKTTRQSAEGKGRILDTRDVEVSYLVSITVSVSMVSRLNVYARFLGHNFGRGRSRGLKYRSWSHGFGLGLQNLLLEGMVPFNITDEDDQQDVLVEPILRLTNEDANRVRGAHGGKLRGERKDAEHGPRVRRVQRGVRDRRVDRSAGQPARFPR